MFISDLNYVENLSESTSIQGGTYSIPSSMIFRSYVESDIVSVNFNSLNNFSTNVNSPYTLTNSASAGAKGDAINNFGLPSYSFTKADTVAVTQLWGGSFSASTSAAVINPAF